MKSDISSIPELLRPRLDQHLEQLAEQEGMPAQGNCAAEVAGTLPMVWSCSDFAVQSCLRDAGLLPWLAGDGRLTIPADSAWLASEL